MMVLVYLSYLARELYGATETTLNPNRALTLLLLKNLQQRQTNFLTRKDL